MKNRPPVRSQDQAGADFSQIETVDAEHAEKGLEDPRDRVVIGTGGETGIRLPVHPGDQEHIDEPAHA